LLVCVSTCHSVHQLGTSSTVTAQVFQFTLVTHELFIVAPEELNVIHIQVPAIISAQVSL